MKESILTCDQMTKDQNYCYLLLCDLFGGAHHVPPVRKHGLGIKISVGSGALSTFDLDSLTRLVLHCHDRCVRAAIVSSWPGRVGIALWRRYKRHGGVGERHPTIEEALARHRKFWPLPTSGEVEP